MGREEVSWDDAIVLDNVNVWIPRAGKQLAFLPLGRSVDIPYPFAAPADVAMMFDAVQELEAFSRGNALIFFGQCVLHQALIGPGFDLDGGSLEGRYLVLTPRRLTRKGALRVSINRSSEAADDALVVG